ncbi:DUF2283 domain-containing protein [candidate division WOR-3 bacterium]|uniref:DUF2283 domain-containing protein n=1 Tax=candidate division WOR-3 bacterium TaxID=2052148 RepID=A0A660SG83_UNCW3|nr:MAG: DUF2283 domain-containing protein [candidate division WOR-3 bacterium]
MKVRYDKEAVVPYIEFKDTIVTTKGLDRDIGIDYDAGGEIAGIEALSASKRLSVKETPRRITPEDLIANDTF